MIIQKANLKFGHAHELKEEFTQTERLIGQGRAGPDGTPGGRQILESNTVTISREQMERAQSQFSSVAPNISDRARELAADFERGLRIQETPEGNNPIEPENPMQVDAQLMKLKTLVESLTGKQMDTSMFAQSMSIGATMAIGAPTQVPTGGAQGLGEQAQTDQGTVNLVYEFEQSYSEFESSMFTATGSVVTESGQTIDVDFSQYSERNYYEENSMSVEMGQVNLKDPLVINLEGQGLELSDEKYQFDLDNDGQKDNVNFATGSSGFLALDLNENGKIDDGSELFGALTGNGFAELAKYDEDGNGFIDSGDSVFEKLQFYQKDANGNDSLQSVKDLNIGAFYLGSQDSPFQVKDSNNDLQAVVRSSGVFINNDGTTGGLQQIDLVV